MVRARVLVALALAVLAFRVGPAGQSSPIAIIGVDAADWAQIDPLIAAGRLPVFSRLKSSGAIGTLEAEPPLLSPIIWTTIATGRRPEDHGVLDFMVDRPGGGQAPVGGGARRTKALWEIFSDANHPVVVAGWWATWPPDHVRGAIVSDRVAVPHVRVDAHDSALVYPPERGAELARAIVAPESIDYAGLNTLVPLTRPEFDAAAASDRGRPGEVYRNPLAHARAALAATRTYSAAATTLLPVVHPAFLAVYFELVDTVSHLFVTDTRRAAAIPNAYVEIDRQIQQIARALDPATLVIVLSDHGFFPAAAGIADDPSDLTAGAAAWHRPSGIIAATTAGALAGTAAAPRMEPLGNVSPLDIAPTVLARARLSVAADMPGHVLTRLAGAGPVTKVASYGPHRLPESAGSDPAAGAELARLRALGYVSGAAAVTTQARVNLGEILFRKGDVPGAIRELEGAVRADPSNQRAGLWLARAYARANRPDDAVRVYDRMLQNAATGTDVDPLVVLAATDLDIQRGRRTAAEQRLARLPAALAKKPETLMARAAVAGNPADAERLLRAAIAAEPASTDAVSRLVDVLLKDGRAEQARRVAAETAARYPESAERHALVGEATLALKRPADAASEFRRALQLSPNSVSVRLELARAELMQNRLDAALDALAPASGPEVDTLRGAALSAKHDWPAAIQALTRAAAASPSIDVLNALGMAQLEAGRAGDAKATFDRSLAIKADQPDIRAFVDRARRQSGQTKQ